MAKTKKEEVVESTTKQEQPKVDEKVDKLKIKPKQKKFNQEEKIYKVDLSKTPEVKEDSVEENAEQETTNVIDDQQTPVVEEIVEEAPQQQDVTQDEATPIIEEVTEEEQKEIEETKEEVVKAVEEAETTGKPLPENVEKLMTFMEETGGDLEDYVKLNRDVSKLDDQDVLYEYYKNTKPHLNAEEINFMMNDEFEYDEEVDDEKTIKRKKLALKEQVASARAHLDGQKSKYYEEIKAGSKLTTEQQKAIDFFNRYNKESEQSQKALKQQKSVFDKKTSEVFNDKFKGFEYSVGDKKFRFNVKDVNKTKEAQSDIGNFVKKFLNEKNSMEDAGGYHKGLFTAMNADAIAQHFYEQGKADATKDSIAKAKNINITPRQAHGETKVGGLKFKVLGESSSDFKFKIKNKK
tara:strand:- start:1006 stop:2226 length:1221 start_codon:yes stop_codon:yes gene_type:complete